MKKRKEAPAVELDDTPQCVRVLALMAEMYTNYEDARDPHVICKQASDKSGSTKA